MSAVDREAILRAVFALSDFSWPEDPDQPDGSQRTFMERSRRVKLFSDVGAGMQPWLGQAEHDEQATQKSGLPYRWEMSVNWIIYHDDGRQPDSLPTVTNNLILSAAETALEPVVQDPGFFEDRNTLLGLVYHCFISGTVIKDPGDVDKQAMIVVPIKILVP